jgi:phenylpyruvate tautomerase PptA (4-oxalocrotonate tautomerase family)
MPTIHIESTEGEMNKKEEITNTDVRSAKKKLRLATPFTDVNWYTPS